MSDQPPRWGEPGYVPPPPPNWGEPGYVAPPRPKVPLRPWQRRALWFALVLAVLGQVAFYVGFRWGGTVCDNGPLYDHPVVAAGGFRGSVGALALVGAVVRSWAGLLRPG